MVGPEQPNNSDSSREPPRGGPDRALWRRSVAADAPEDEAARLLDLAGFADGLLDADDRERVAEWLRQDPDAAADIAVAQALSAVPQLAAPPEAVVVRAAALVGSGGSPAATVIPFPVRRQHLVRPLAGLARWGSLVAAMAFASWLGFTLGVDTSRSVAPIGQASDDGFLQELLDPATALMRDVGESTRT